MPDSTRQSDEAPEGAEDQIDDASQSDEPSEADSGDADDSGEHELVAIPEVSDSGDASPLREMVEYVARALTSNPDAVSVSEEDDGNRTIFHLSVDEKDKGKVIGRDGRVAQSIRSLLRVAATKQGTRITLEID